MVFGYISSFARYLEEKVFDTKIGGQELDYCSHPPI